MESDNDWDVVSDYDPEVDTVMDIGCSTICIADSD